MKTIKINKKDSILDILRKLKEFKNNITLHPNYIFRGQADSSWPLNPSLTRIAVERKLTRAQTIQLERESINLFMPIAKTLLPAQNTMPISNGVNYEFYSWLITMQHYSAPTRLLDWTSSLLVALYFSCNSENNSDGVIWIGNFAKINDSLQSPNNFHTNSQIDNFGDEIITLTAGVSNERIIAQKGLFTSCTNPLSDHMVLISKLGALVKVIIPKEIKVSVMQELFKMNINATTLFPGLDGLGKTIRDYCSLWDSSSVIR